jgi:2-polyprenyl-6-hydroxyphenyl methylase/3-demethylubiquinone-9 3-methyltransferase
LKNNQRAQFDFGANWKSFSERALTATDIDAAKKDFVDLTNGIDLRGRSFLDIGFGAGLSLLIAALMGANAIGCDVDPLCAEVLRSNQDRYFPDLDEMEIPVVTGSILDEAIVDLLRARSPDQTTRTYDIVHAWGALHHTGDMKQAIRIAASLVAPGGYLILAIYSRHWSSKMWRIIKRFYNRSPHIVRRLLIGFSWPMIFLAKWLATRRNPLKQTRGMNFHYDIVDWIGGYPYEFATAAEIKQLVEPLGFWLMRIIPATVPTGCNQFVFRSQFR